MGIEAHFREEKSGKRLSEFGNINMVEEGERKGTDIRKENRPEGCL